MSPRLLGFVRYSARAFERWRKAHRATLRVTPLTRKGNFEHAPGSAKIRDMARGGADLHRRFLALTWHPKTHEPTVLRPRRHGRHGLAKRRPRLGPLQRILAKRRAAESGAF